MNRVFVLSPARSSGRRAQLLTRPESLAQRLLFPYEFVGRGDMSRAVLLLRCVAQNKELDYIPAIGAARRGQRPQSFQIISKRRLTSSISPTKAR